LYWWIVKKVTPVDEIFWHDDGAFDLYIYINIKILIMIVNNIIIIILLLINKWIPIN